MNTTLLVSKLVCRNAFQKEDYIGDDDIFALVISGSFVFDNGSGKQAVGPFEGVNFRRGIRYQRKITQEAHIYLFRYRSNEDVFGNGKVIFQDINRIKSTIQLLKIADSLIQQDDYFYKQQLFLDLMNQYRLEQANQCQEAIPKDDAVGSAISHIHDNLHRKLNLKELAENHYLSYIQFSRRFQKATGATPQEYIVGLRLKKAKHLLAETEMKIQQIAEVCGFSNAYYFCNFFRNHCKISPTKYRNLVKRVDGEEDIVLQ